MDYTLSDNGSGMEVHLNGRLLFSDNDKFREIVEKLKARNGGECVIDLKDLEFIDSAGLGMLLIARETATGCNTVLKLRGAHGQVDHILKVSKFDSLIPSIN